MWQTGPLADEAMPQFREGKKERWVLPLQRAADVFDTTTSHVYATLLAARNYYVKGHKANRRFGMARNEFNWYAAFLIRPRGQLRNPPSKRPNYDLYFQSQRKDSPPREAAAPVGKVDVRPKEQALSQSPGRRQEPASSPRVKPELAQPVPPKTNSEQKPKGHRAPTPPKKRQKRPMDRDDRRRRRADASTSSLPSYSDGDEEQPTAKPLFDEKDF